MATDALTPPAGPQPKTVFAELHRGRLGARPWAAFIFDQADEILQADGVAPQANSVGQPRFDGRNQFTTLWTDSPAKLADLEGRAHAYHQAGRMPDDTDATVAYEELDAARAAGTLAAIAALGYQVRGTFIPWT